MREVHQPINIRLFELALGLSCGILLGYFYAIPDWIQDSIPLGITLVLCISFYLAFHSKVGLWWVFRLWLFSLWVVVGGVHYTNQLIPIAALKSHETHAHTDINKAKLHALDIHYRLKSWGKTKRYIAHYYCPNNKGSHRIVVHAQDTLTSTILSPGKTLWTNAQITTISGSKTPGGFDPKSYYHSQGILAMIQLDKRQIYCWTNHELSIRGAAQQLSNKLASHWKTASISPQSKALALAILLGQTEYLGSELKTQFAHAGALHILALSGLHVGLVVLLLQYLLRPIKYLVHGNIIRATILLFLLWGYALICGLSPSITRAVCMFSIWQLGQVIGRPISGANSMLLTYLILLWWSPFWLFSVGFQLSFAAVMALTYIPAQMLKIWWPKHKIVRYVLQLNTLGFAAQIGVGPLSVFYFHQFPLLFWLSNLIILPLLTPLIVSGLIITLGARLINIPPLLYQGWEQWLNLIVQSIQWIARHEHFLLKDLTLNSVNLWRYYVLFIFLWWGLQHPWISLDHLTRRLLPYSICIILYTGIAQKQLKQTHAPEFALLHRYGATAIIANTSKGYWALINNKNQNKRPVQDWTRHYQVPLTGTRALKSMMTFGKQPLLVIDSIGVYPQLTQSIVLLTNNADVHFETLVNDLKPTIILADASNAKYIVRRWRSRAAGLNQKFLDTYELGTIESSSPDFKTYF